MSQKTKLTNIYNCDISQTDENGAFPCPNCGQTLSPDDHSEDNYVVYETVMTENNLTEVVLYCKGCLSFIHLIGFQRLTLLK